MKNLLFLFFSIFFITLQGGDFYTERNNLNIAPEAVPKSAKKYVTRNYPEAYDIKWAFKGKESLYKSEFRVKGEKYRLIFSPKGKLIFFKGIVHSSELPTKIKKYVKKYYSGYNITKVEKTSSFKYNTYKVKIEGDLYGGSRTRILKLDQKGNILH